MKKVVKYLLIGILIIGVIYATVFFISTNNQSPIKYETENPARISIRKRKQLQQGKVVPEDQVEIKPQISGIIRKYLCKRRRCNNRRRFNCCY